MDTPQGTITYVYNGDNQRVMKTTATGTTHYVFDGLSVVAELDATGTVTKAYNPGISYTDDQGSTFYYMYDGLGSVVNLVDEDQNIVQAYSYDPFGQSVKGDFNSERYLAHYCDDHVDLYYFYARWLDPALGRFISVDPYPGLDFMPQWKQKYAYAASNPFRYTDPLGTKIHWSGYKVSDPNTVKRLEYLDELNGPADIYITDGDRPADADYGAPNSQHKAGRAADLYMDNYDPQETARLALKAGFTGISDYDDQHVHVDTRSGSPWYGHNGDTVRQNGITTLPEWYWPTVGTNVNTAPTAPVITK